MSQKFYTSTIVSKYIKYLLAYTPLPLYPTIEHNQYMLKDCLYIYKDRVLKCTKSGIFSAVLLENYHRDLEILTARDDIKVQDNKKVKDYLSVYTAQQFERDESGDLKPVYEDDCPVFKTNNNGNKVYEYVQLPLCVTDDYCTINNITFSEYDVVNAFKMNEFVPGVTQQFISTSNSYDSVIHKQLGQYLRLIKNQYDLDLMPLYNCYAQEVVNDISISKTQPYISTTSIKSHKVMLVPIKFNTTYTIAMDCNSPILLKAIIYTNGLTTLSDGSYISNFLHDKVIQKNNTQFSKPFTFKIDNMEGIDDNQSSTIDSYTIGAKELQQFEKHLYLAIQVPANLNSTLSVIEGDYTSVVGKVINDISVINVNDPSKVFSSLVSSPLLLNLNDGKQHAFSDKLISYLLRNTIDNREYIDENVEFVERSIGYKPKHYGLWDDSLRYILHQQYTNLIEDRRRSNYDILGYVDLDVEDAIRKGYIKYGN